MAEYLDPDVGIAKIIRVLRAEGEPGLNTIERLLKEVAALGDCKVLPPPPRGTHAGSVHVTSEKTSRPNAFFAVTTEHHHNRNAPVQAGHFNVQVQLLGQPGIRPGSGWRQYAYHIKKSGGEWWTYHVSNVDEQELKAIIDIARLARRSFETVSG